MTKPGKTPKPTDNFKAIAAIARKAAAVARDNAAYGGRMDDGGASRLEDIVDAWEAGLKNEIPASLMGYAKQAAQEADPDWAEYQRLHAKFNP